MYAFISTMDLPVCPFVEVFQTREDAETRAFMFLEENFPEELAELRLDHDSFDAILDEFIMGIGLTEWLFICEVRETPSATY